MNKKTSFLLAATFGSLALFTVSAKADEKVNFEKQIYPIFEAKCLKCHTKETTDAATGKVKKPKAGLAMDSSAGLIKGGKESKEKTLVAGKADESELYKLTLLPPSDEMAMPPDGKADPLTDAEKALLKKWIDDGADFGGWKGNE